MFFVDFCPYHLIFAEKYNLFAFYKPVQNSARNVRTPPLSAGMQPLFAADTALFADSGAYSEL